MKEKLKNIVYEMRSVMPYVFPIFIVLGVILILLAARAGYTFYSSTVDTSEMVAQLESMQNELGHLQSTVSENMILVDSAGGDLSGTKEILSEELSMINEQIIVTNKEITSLLSDISSTDINSNTKYDELVKRYTNVSDGVENVTSSIEEFSIQISQELAYLESDITGNHVQTMETLLSIKNTMSQAGQDFESGIQESFDSIGKAFTNLETISQKGFNNLESSINNQTTAITDMVTNNNTAVEGYINSQTTSLENTLGNHMSGISNELQTQTLALSNKVDTNSSAIDNLESHLQQQDEKLESVFQSASEGKTLLAGTLTGYGVATANDASFQTINDGINTVMNNTRNSIAEALEAKGVTIDSDASLDELIEGIGSISTSFQMVSGGNADSSWGTSVTASAVKDGDVIFVMYYSRNGEGPGDDYGSYSYSTSGQVVFDHSQGSYGGGSAVRVVYVQNATAGDYCYANAGCHSGHGHSYMTALAFQVP